MLKLIFVLLLSCTNMFAAAQSMRIEGLILDEHKRPLAGSTLKLSPAPLIRTSDTQGAFHFSGLKKQQYVLRVSHIGYSPQEIIIKAEDLERPLMIQMERSSLQLEEVVVLDHPSEHLSREEPMNIVQVNEDYIRKNLGGSLMHSLEKIPGLSLIGIGSGQSKPLIRGLGFNRVAVIDKGIKHEGQQWGADHGLEIDQFAVHHAEIVKGVASFMYGSDAIGGVINIQPKPIPPTHTLAGSLDVIGKSNNHLYGTSLNLYGRNDHWYFDTRFSHQSYGDYRVPTDTVYVYDFAVRLHDQQVRNTAGRETNLHLDLGYLQDDFQTIFYLSNTHNSSGFFANAHGLEPRNVDTQVHDHSRRDILHPYQQASHFKAINRSVLNLNRHLLEAELGYQRNFRQEWNQYVNHGYMPPHYPEESSISEDLEREFEKNVFSLHLKDEFSLARHQLNLGIHAEHQTNEIGGWGFLIPAFRQTTLGAFAYDKYAIKDDFYVHAALRYDYGHIRMHPYQDWFASEVTTEEDAQSIYVIRAQDLSREFHNLVWSAGLNYQLGKLDLKAHLGKSFRMPIAKELGANGVNYHYFSYERGDAELDPEQSYQLDMGLQWTEKKWSVSLTPFFNYFTNYIYLNPTAEYDYLYGAGNQIFEYTQSEVIRYGGELSLAWSFYKNLGIEAQVEYLYARQLSGDKAGFTLPFSPPPSALLSLSWSPEMKGPLQNTFFSLDYRLTARQHNIVPPERMTAAFQLIHLQAGTEIIYQEVPISINLQVQNLLNTHYMMHTSFYRLIGLPEAGRNIILSLRIPFTIKHN